MRLWLDMANSPHPVLFRALTGELASRGHEVLVTTRDHGQTRDLTHETWPEAEVVGTESPGALAGKAANIGRRVAELRRWARGRDIDVAASLNSYAQIVAARAARLPVVTLMDYEYQPANHLSFRLANRVVVPAAFPADRLRIYGARPRRVTRFEGYKEELYLDASPRAEDASPFTSGSGSRAVFRPPAQGALYHRGANEAFDRLLATVADRDDVEVLVLPRLEQQRRDYGAMPGVTVPDGTVDGLAALRTCDVFVGAGGTMSREAALLGVRAYTMFAGRLPAVDEALMAEGRLHDLRDLDGATVDWSPRSRGEREDLERRRRARGDELRRWFVSLLERAARA